MKNLPAFKFPKKLFLFLKIMREVIFWLEFFNAP